MSEIVHGDCLEVMQKLEDNSVDAIVTDPPYGLSFMGKKWDYDVPSVEIWKECLRVLKPGGYLLSFAGTRTQHRMAVRIEDAGFEIRDMIAWVYGSGFPKSLNIGKAVDKMQGNEREVVEERTMIQGGGNALQMRMGERKEVNADITKGTSEWEGWGTALKPALEPITVARKPIEGTVAENCLKWGVGGINIDGCRVGTEGGGTHCDNRDENGNCLGHKNAEKSTSGETIHAKETGTEQGRFPANLIHDGSDEVVSLFPNDSQRFFYSPKASKSERNRGCEGLEEIELRGGGGRAEEGYDENDPEQKRLKDAAQAFGAVKSKKSNFHPTVKPIALMEYLVKLVSKEGHLVLDPFAGSGSTLIACQNLKRNYLGIEREADYITIAKARLCQK